MMLIYATFLSVNNWCSCTQGYLKGLQKLQYTILTTVQRDATQSSLSQMKHQLDATLCRFYFCRVTLHVSGASAHHQVGVSFDLCYDARKHKIKIYTKSIANSVELCKNSLWGGKKKIYYYSLFETSKPVTVSVPSLFERIPKYFLLEVN